MNWGRSAVVVGCVLLLVVGAAVATGVAGGGVPAQNPSIGLAAAEIDAGESAPAVQAATGSDIRLTQQLGLVPQRPGIYKASYRYRLPDHLRALEVTLPEGATAVSTTGFKYHEGRVYEWDGTTTRPRIDYRLPANQSTDRSGPIGGPGRLTFVDVGEWALVAQPRASHSWEWTRGNAAIGFQRSMAAEQGVAGSAIAYLGTYEEHTTTAHNQTFRLIVPERATLEEPPAEVLTAMANASGRLRVGDRDAEVFAVAAPTTETLDWGVRGLQTGDADLWVRDFERLTQANSVWLHEYVHTRQAYTTATDARWMTEASAVYYAALLSLEDGQIPYASVRDRFALGEREYGGSVMARPTTWQRNANYYVGTLVAGELDRQLRLATDGRTTLQEVFRRMNAKDGTITAADIGGFLQEAGGSDVERVGERHTTTTERPTAWDPAAHREAFGSLPVRITYALPVSGDAIRVNGPYRTRALGTAESVTLVPGERLTLNVVATNVGEVGGEYEAVVRVNNEQRASDLIRLGAGKSTTVTFEHTFEELGGYVVSVGDASVRVTVREPATPQVTGLTVDRTDVTTGESIEVAVGVRNGDDYPGRLEVPVTRNGKIVETQVVRLDAASKTTVRTDLGFDEPGAYVIGVDTAASDTAVVRVANEVTETETTETSASTPGFGPVIGVVAILLWIVRQPRYR